MPACLVELVRPRSTHVAFDMMNRLSYEDSAQCRLCFERNLWSCSCSCREDDLRLFGGHLHVVQTIEISIHIPIVFASLAHACEPCPQPNHSPHDQEDDHRRNGNADDVASQTTSAMSWIEEGVRIPTLSGMCDVRER